MPMTQADLDAVEAAIRAARDGTRKTSLSSESGAMSLMATPLPDLLLLRESIVQEVNAAAAGSGSRSRVFLTRHRRGL